MGYIGFSFEQENFHNKKFSMSHVIISDDVLKATAHGKNTHIGINVNWEKQA